MLSRTLAACVSIALAGTVGAATTAPAAARAVVAPHSVCIDSSSPTATLDRRVVGAAGRVVGTQPSIYAFDGSLGVSERLFKFLMREHCALIMGFPVDQRDADPPRGLALTRSYFETGYVLVGYEKALTIASIPKNSSVAVGLGTVPNFYLVGALATKPPPLKAEGFDSQNEALDSLVARRVSAAMLWEPSVIAYRSTHRAPLVVTPLPIDHGRWHLAALYDPKSAAMAKTFERGLSLLATSGELAKLTVLSSGKKPL